MKKIFNWSTMNLDFMRAVILASPYAEEFKPKMDSCDDEDAPDRFASFMNKICAYPDNNFIYRYRNVIERHLLRKYPEVCKEIFRVMNIPMGSMNERLDKLYKKSTSSSLADCYSKALLRISGLNAPINEYSKFKYLVSVDMKNTPVEEVPLYDFQKEAQERMYKYYIDNDGKAGLLVMPTGSGKSRTATTFLIKELIGRGYQVLWIAHRHMLIDQAADCFERFAGLAKVNDPKIKHYRISCISGQHQSIKQVGDSEIIVASISSLYRNKPHLKRVLKNKLMVVVDEAHHTVADSYDDIVHFIFKNKKNVKLLGLTATPVRMNEKATGYLMNQYENNIIYSVPMSNLISSGILSDPHFIKVETGQNFEPLITKDEEKLMCRYRELPETLIGKIAASHIRNEVILKQYFDHCAEYGKTLIFAMNMMHCRLLVDELKENGVKCDGVWSGREDNSAIIDRFRRGDLDVLVNVNIMTEGTDVPDIRTVFLTRPTQSEGFLMQMIGRGMRGKQAGGTEAVNIVDFHDKWETFNKWLDPQWLIEGEGDKPEKSSDKKHYEYDEIEWSLCKDAYKELCYKHFEIEESVAVPCGWYSFLDEYGEPERMLVFDNYLDGIKKLIADRDRWISDKSISPAALRDMYFTGMGYRPSLRDIELLAENIRNREVLPHIFPIEGRKKIEPSIVLKRAALEGKDVFAFAGQVYDDNPLAEDLFETKEKYIMAVCRAKVYENQLPLGSKVEELPMEMIPFSREPFYDVEELMKEVINERFNGTYDGISGIKWTDKAVKSYFGMFYPDSNSIFINCVLNSKDVPREVVKFVIYHELLHRDILPHNAEFREREHKYPDYVNCEHFLYDHMNQFDIKEW
ncbi:MAG: DEAD/DEAH box helicase [Oribacterium sp.]|nr:DEAD/DEAH box helicase [Oribacterium sp.]